MTLHALQIGMGWFTEQPGGLNRVYADLLSALSRQDVECRGLVIGSPQVERESGGLARSFAAHGASQWSRMRGLRAAALPWLRDHQRDGVVVSHFAKHAFPILDHVKRRPLVIHFQGPWAEETRVEGAGASTAAVRAYVERQVYRRATAAIVLSRAFGRILSCRYGVDPARIHVIPGGVDAGRFAGEVSSADARARLGWPTDRRIVLCVRRLVNRVGLQALVDACVPLRARVPEALVLIAGSGPLREELEARIASRGVADHVRLVGFVPDDMLPTAYRAADLTVVPSQALEGFGLVTVESLAAGTPCVVTPVDGLAEIMEHWAPQLITASPSAADIAHTLSAALLGEVALPAAHGCAAYARDNHDWHAVAARVRCVYEQAVS